MSRIRTIKPEIWLSEDYQNLSPAGRLAFVYMITNADDEGRLRTSAGHLARNAVGDSAAVDDVRDELERMQQQGMVTLYEIGGATYAELAHWEDHQRVSHPRESTLPGPPADLNSGGFRRPPENSGGFQNIPHVPTELSTERTNDHRARADETDLRLAKEQAELEGWLRANRYGSETRHAFMLCQQEGIRAADVIALAKIEIKSHKPRTPLAYIVKSPELLARLRKHGAPAPEFAAAVGELVQKFAVDA